MPQRDHICICICTYKRPELLKGLLLKMEKQKSEGLFDYSIVVVDNDKFESGRMTTETHARNSKISIRYYVEPEQNIALARNKAVKNAIGDFVAFIDDDEFPSDDWLLNLYNAIKRYKSDGILGPVFPYFIKKPPVWVLKGGFFDRPTYITGHIVPWATTQTGNVLLRRELFKNDQVWFNPVFCSGGEDRDFFRRKIEEGYFFVWCNEAQVFEIIPPKRWEKKVLLKRALLRGKMALNIKGARSVSLLKSVFAVIIYTCCLPLFLALGFHVFMRYLIKICDHLGKILTFIGIDCVKEKYVVS